MSDVKCRDSSRIETTPQGGGTPLRGLTHSLDLSKEGLAVNATRTCSVEGCADRHYGLGYCKRHYDRNRPPRPCPAPGCDRNAGQKSKYCPMHQARMSKRGTLEGPPPPIEVCSAPGCANPHVAKGWCATHYDRMRRNGTLNPAPRMPVAERIKRKVIHRDMGFSSQCWIYQGPVNNAGYTCMKVGHLAERRTELVHRASYREFVGEIPTGLTIDHLCRVRTCCNPDHLEAVTQAENNRRAREAVGR